ncbi:MAG TPA: YIP1 family protein [Symbiobacteriaceae bacterium]|nr:YIP1 family protein [Symbiobacteriaceae bacterium]
MSQGYGGPFLLLNIPSAHFLWLTTALILHVGCRLLGGTGSFRRVLQVTGVAMYAYVAIGLINYLHLLWPLPSVTLEASAFYRPSLGLGQLAIFVWLAVVLYQTARQVHGLPALGALLAAPLPVLVALLLYLASAGFFFRLVPLLVPGDWHPNDWLALANGAYMAATVGLTGAMAVVTRRWWKAGGRP